jgi:hypothetical protein
MSTPAAAANADPFQALDDSKISRFQLKIMFVSGMGFFTDATRRIRRRLPISRLPGRHPRPEPCPDHRRLVAVVGLRLTLATLPETRGRAWSS